MEKSAPRNNAIALAVRNRSLQERKAERDKCDREIREINRRIQRLRLDIELCRGIMHDIDAYYGKTDISQPPDPDDNAHKAPSYCDFSNAEVDQAPICSYRGMWKILLKQQRGNRGNEEIAKITGVPVSDLKGTPSGNDDSFMEKCLKLTRLLPASIVTLEKSEDGKGYNVFRYLAPRRVKDKQRRSAKMFTQDKLRSYLIHHAKSDKRDAMYANLASLATINGYRLAIIHNKRLLAIVNGN